MSSDTSIKTVAVLRVGNPWLIGHNYERVVPIYVLQSFCAPEFKKNPEIRAIKHLAFDAQFAIDKGLKDRVDVQTASFEDLSKTTEGVLSPDRRLFPDRSNGGAHDKGAPFPIVGGLLDAGGGSDEGLGARARELMLRNPSDWRTRLRRLLCPAAPRDPVTEFAWALLGGAAGTVNEGDTPVVPPPLASLDAQIAQFIDNLIVDRDDARRIPTIRALACGLYLGVVMRMVAGPVVESGGGLPHVMVYGGLPPGDPDDPLVIAATKSFQAWITRSWDATATRMSAVLDGTETFGNPSDEERVENQFRIVLAESLGNRKKDYDALLAGLQPTFVKMATAGLGVDGARVALEDIGFPKSELARRVRSLGANIGFAGPDRGKGATRLMFDTPLLGVLVRGVLGNSVSMEFDEFVTALANRFGLVVGLGEAESVAGLVEIQGAGGYDPYEILRRNQELLRERLLRVGLARAYSDSHTEVFNNG